MSNISVILINIPLTSYSLSFKYPMLLLLLIPAAALTVLPYFRLRKRRSRTIGRIISLCVHIVVILLSTALLTGLTFHSSEDGKKPDLLLLVDMSDSMYYLTDRVDGFVKSVLERNNSSHKIGVIVFANGQLYVTEPGRDDSSTYDSYKNAVTDPKRLPDGSATDIASALLYAQELFPVPRDGRIILITDGLETDGNAASAAKAVAGTGTRVDVFFVAPYKYEREVQLIALNIPDSVTVGEPFELTVAAQSSATGSAVITIYDNTQIASERTVTLKNGINAFDIETEISSVDLRGHRLNLTL